MLLDQVHQSLLELVVQQVGQLFLNLEHAGVLLNPLVLPNTLLLSERAQQAWADQSVEDQSGELNGKVVTDVKVHSILCLG